MIYNFNGWTLIKADGKREANKKLKELLLDIVDCKNINFIENLNGAWKKYNFNGWFDVNARSETEALKKIKINLVNTNLVLSDESGDIEIDVSYLVDDMKSGILHKFVMTNGSNCIHQTMAISAKHAWEDLRSNFIYDEHVILTQVVNTPCAISPKCCILDAKNNTKTPSSLTHQVIIAVGFAGESWWGKMENVINVDKEGFISNKLISVLS